MHDIQGTLEEARRAKSLRSVASRKRRGASSRGRRGASSTRRSAATTQPLRRGPPRQCQSYPRTGADGQSSQLAQTERTEETIVVSNRVNRLRQVRLVINRDVTNPNTSTYTPPSGDDNAPPDSPPYTYSPTGTRQHNLPWYYPVHMPVSSSTVTPTTEDGAGPSCSGNSSSTGAEVSAGTQPMWRSGRRLTHYIPEPNVGRGYIKEITFGVGGRIIASPFGYGVRLLSFDPECSELCDRTTDFATAPIQLHEVVTNICHGSVVVTTKFSPDSSLLVTGSLGGKVGFHRPRW